MAGPFDTLQKWGSSIYGKADEMLGGKLPMGPIQGDHRIPLNAYIEKRRIKGEVLEALRNDVEYYIKSGLAPELAVKLVLQNKRMDFENILNPETDQARAIASGDTKSELGRNAHQTANIYKYFENASPKEYANMFKGFGITDIDYIKGAFTLPDTGYSEEVDPGYNFNPYTGGGFRKPSLTHLPSPEFNKLGLVQDETGEWVPGTTQPVGGYGAELSRINRANPNAGPQVGYPVSLRTGQTTNGQTAAPVTNKQKTQKVSIA